MHPNSTTTLQTNRAKPEKGRLFQNQCIRSVSTSLPPFQVTALSLPLSLMLAVLRFSLKRAQNVLPRAVILQSPEYLGTVIVEAPGDFSLRKPSSTVGCWATSIRLA